MKKLYGLGHVRLSQRRCNYFQKILNSSRNDCYCEAHVISEDLWQDLEAKISERANDKQAVVRQAACSALARLQDPDNTEEGSVVQTYLNLLENDPAR